MNFYRKIKTTPCGVFALLFAPAMAVSTLYISEVADAQKTPSSAPNVIVIYADDLDFDEINAYRQHPAVDFSQLPTHSTAEINGFPHTGPRDNGLGYNYIKRWETPNLDYIAKEGAIFSNFYITSPVCTPSRYSLLTGKYASRAKFLRSATPQIPELKGNLIVGFNTYLDNERLINDYIRDDYKTGIVGKWHNSKNNVGVSRGIANKSIHDPKIAATVSENYDKITAHLLNEHNFDYADAIYASNIHGIGVPKDLLGQHGHNLEWIISGAERFIENNHESPFFLYVSLPMPHGWLGSIGDTTDTIYTPSGVLPNSPQTIMPSRESVRERLGGASNAEMALWMDDGLGAIIQTLKKHQIDDNTVIIFTSDHQNRGKESVYEGAKVPTIMYWPDVIEPGTKIDALLANIDILPTIADLANKPVDSEVDGKSFAKILRGEKESIRDELLLEIGGSKAVVTQRHKYIVNWAPDYVMQQMNSEKDIELVNKKWGWNSPWVNWNKKRITENSPSIHYNPHLSFPSYFEEFQLYDLKKDPFEQRNLFEDTDYEPVREDLERRLENLLKDTDQSFTGINKD